MVLVVGLHGERLGWSYYGARARFSEIFTIHTNGGPIYSLDYNWRINYGGFDEYEELLVI